MALQFQRTLKLKTHFNLPTPTYSLDIQTGQTNYFDIDYGEIAVFWKDSISPLESLNFFDNSGFGS